MFHCSWLKNMENQLTGGWNKAKEPGKMLTSKQV